LENWRAGNLGVTKVCKVKHESIKYYLLILLFALFSASCDDNYVSSIPNYYVYLQLNLTSTYPTFKNSTNKSLIFIKGVTPNIPEGQFTGYGGIMVYSEIMVDDYGNTIYCAFDMSCPYEHKPTIRVYPKKDGFGQVVCDSCKSVFNIGYGYGDPTPESKAKEYLKRYRTQLSRDILYINR
jgi:hypothetical protein